MYITFKQQDLVGWLMYSRKKNLKMPKGGNQNPYIDEEQTTQCQKKKYKRTNNDLQNIHIKLKIE